LVHPARVPVTTNAAASRYPVLRMKSVPRASASEARQSSELSPVHWAYRPSASPPVGS
jgi:hypothetical protein